MYGLVNRVFADLVVSNHGQDAWAAILRKTGVDSDPVVVMDVYDDDITFQLVEATSLHLGTEAHEVLEDFGKHWIGHLATEGWASLIALTGDNLLQFLTNLDRLHATVSSTMTAARMPTFKVRETTETTIKLDYMSTRKGLAPMVTGLLIGLSDHFDDQYSVQSVHSDESGDSAHHTFLLTKLPTLASAP